MLRTFMIFLIRAVSSFFRALGCRACRFEPSCSVYAVEAFRHFRLTRAIWVSSKRICRCHPLSAGGYDPIPAGIGE